jgi:hypothetical protein
VIPNERARRRRNDDRVDRIRDVDRGVATVPAGAMLAFRMRQIAPAAGRHGRVV